MEWQAFSLQEHPLKNTDDHACGMYLSFLLSIAGVEKNKVFHDKMVDFTASVLEATEAKVSLMSVAKMAQQIDGAKLKDFSQTLVLAELAENFMVDAFLCSVLMEGNSNKTLQYIIDLGGVLHFDQEQIKAQMQLSRIILEQDKIAFKKMCKESVPLSISRFRMYSKAFSDLFVINEWDAYQTVKYDEYEDMVFSNLALQGEPENSNISDVKNLFIVNCQFGPSSSEYTISDCEKVVIKDCSFRGFSNTALHIYDCQSVEFIDCQFADCIQNVDEGYCLNAATLQVSDTGNLKINGCHFENCHAVPALSVMGLQMPSSPAIARLDNVAQFRLRETTFINCISNTTFKEKGTLFVLEQTECGKASSCSRNNCCDIGDERLGKW